MLPFNMPSPITTTSADATRAKIPYITSEPGTITLKQSAFRVHWASPQDSDMNLRLGSQAYRAYNSVNTVVAGMFSVQQRFDSGSAQGEGLTFAAGLNEFVVDAYVTNNEANNISGLIVLNYESDVPTQGIGAASHTVRENLISFDAGAVNGVNTAASLAITPSNYWLNAVGFCITLFSGNSVGSYAVLAEYAAGEGLGAGWSAVVSVFDTDAERGSHNIWFDFSRFFKRCPQDADTSRMDLEVARKVKVKNFPTTMNGLSIVATVHHITYTAAASVSGNNASLPTTVRLHLTDTDEVIQEQVLSAGTTAFSFTVYDKRQYYVSAYQDNTHVGRSGDATPT
jgi:hypothetical protein